mgnify:CR=1 FL=1
MDVAPSDVGPSIQAGDRLPSTLGLADTRVLPGPRVLPDPPRSA